MTAWRRWQNLLEDEEYLPPSSVADGEINTDRLDFTALCADRYRFSSRGAAALINDFQRDIGRVTQDNTTHVLAPMKLWRARSRVRADAAQEAASVASAAGIRGLYFDGRKDKTAVSASTNIREEHVVVLSEPGSEYLGHFSPQSGRAADLFRELHAVALQFGADVKVLGCDGTAVNTGTRGGVCRLFELFTGQSVHWFICQLHANELNLRGLFQSLDGATTGPRSFSGPLGSQCAGDVWRLPVVEFRAVPGAVEEIPGQLLKELSVDQELLYRLAWAVQNGHLPDATAGRAIGALNHARWLTLAARLLRLYASTERPSSALAQIAQFLVGHYVPMWFRIRRHSSCAAGAQNFLISVQLLRDLPDATRRLVEPVLARNSHWAHPEQVLLAMAADDDRSIREEAVRLIRGARERQRAEREAAEEEEVEEVRPFHLPTVNFCATGISQLIDWEKETVTEPPLLCHLDDDGLGGIIETPLTVAPYPVHTQAVERAVKTVTEACGKVHGEEARHSYICATIKHRRLLPVFNCKRDLKL